MNDERKTAVFTSSFIVPTSSFFPYPVQKLPRPPRDLVRLRDERADGGDRVRPGVERRACVLARDAADGDERDGGRERGACAREEFETDYGVGVLLRARRED